MDESQDHELSDGAKYLGSWDPLANSIRTQLRTQADRVAAGLPMRRARTRHWAHNRLLTITAQPISALFVTIAISAIVGAVILAFLNWPIWGHYGNRYADITLAAGSATAFGAIVFSVISTAFTRAAEIAPGYSVVVLNRRSPWMSGIGIITVSALLLAFAAANPTFAGALVAVLVAMSAVTWSWIAARSSLAASDPLAIARDAGSHYRRAIVRTAKWVRTSSTLGLPRQVRSDPDLVHRLIWKHQQNIVAGLLRQIRAGVLSTATSNNLVQSVVLFESLIDAFDDYARMVDGEIGPHDGLPTLLLNTADVLMDTSVQGDSNESGQYVIKQVVRLAGAAYRDPDYASLRTLVGQRLVAWLERMWNNDISTVPAASVVALGELVRTWTSIGAYEDAQRELSTLSTVANKAIVANRVHIGQAATSQLAAALPALANVQHSGVREQNLRRWTEATRPLFMAAPDESTVGLVQMTDPLVPGISLIGGPRLQEELWRIEPAALEDTIGSLLAMLREIMTEFATPDIERGSARHGLAGYLTVVYQALLVVVPSAQIANGPTLTPLAEIPQGCSSNFPTLVVVGC